MTYYMPMSLLEWSAVRTDNGRLILHPDSEVKAAGFIPVYTSLEDLREDFPTTEYQTLTEKDTAMEGTK